MNPPKRPSLDLTALPPELQRKLRADMKRKGSSVRVRRAPLFPKDEVRRYAFRCLAVLADLKQHERRRVLAQAAKLNDL